MNSWKHSPITSIWPSTFLPQNCSIFVKVFATFRVWFVSSNVTNRRKDRRSEGESHLWHWVHSSSGSSNLFTAKNVITRVIGYRSNTSPKCQPAPRSAWPTRVIIILPLFYLCDLLQDTTSFRSRAIEKRCGTSQYITPAEIINPTPSWHAPAVISCTIYKAVTMSAARQRYWYGSETLWVIAVMREARRFGESSGAARHLTNDRER